MQWSIRKTEGVLAAATLALGLGIGFALLGRGAWLDEFWTLVTTQPDQSWARFWSLMAHEVHPPLHYILVEAARKIGVSDIAALRALNLLGVPLVFIALGYALRRKALDGGQACALLAIYASSPMFLDTLADLRAYFLLYSAGIAVAVLARVLMRAAARSEPWDWPTLALWFLSLFVFVNLHYYAVLMGGLLTTALILVRRGRGILAFAAVSALAATPAVILFAVQRSSGTDLTSWIQTGRIDAILLMLDQTWAAGAGNVVAFGLAVTMLLIGLQRRALQEEQRDSLVLLAALAVFFAFLAVVNFVRPIVIDRYLIAGGGCALTALVLLAVAPQSPRWSVVAICTFALLSQVRAVHTGDFERTYAVHVRRGWIESAEAVRTMVAACPSARVFIDPSIYAGPHDMFTEARRFGMNYYAARFGFQPQEIAAGEKAPDPGACPNIVWFEHVLAPPQRAADMVAGAKLEFTGQVEMVRAGSGVVLINSAARS
ncbi:MAG: hypothetical protein ABUL73_02790 [Alphaproteobacteria bacterium]